MAIRIIYGPGGAGKSLYQVGQVVIPELVKTRRNIVTNLALIIPRLQEYIEQTYPNEHIEVAERVRILSDDETREFWKHRGVRRAIIVDGSPVEYREDKGEFGVCYIIDEAGVNGFDAQGWASQDGGSPRGVRCKWYLDQQRKFGDDVYASTNGRAPSSIAKGFRDKAHGFVRLKNMRLAQWGPFKGSDKFKWQEFASEPSSGSNIDPIRWGEFQLDAKGVSSCYRTEQGVGVLGSVADKGARAKGIHIAWVFPMALGLGACCALIPWAMGKATQKVLTGEKSTIQQKVKGALEQVPQKTPPAGENFLQSGPVQLEPGLKGKVLSDKEARQKATELYVTGYVTLGSKITVSLSDGTTLTEADGVQRVERNAVYLRDGRRLAMKQPESRPMVPRGTQLPVPSAAKSVPTEEKRGFGTQLVPGKNLDDALRMRKS